MLSELLSMKACDDFNTAHPGFDAFNAGHFFTKGAPVEVRSELAGEPPYPGGPFWLDAEDYLQQLDLACRLEDSQTKKRLRRLVGRHIESLKAEDATTLDARIHMIRDAALRVIAFQCRGFTDEADLASESWLPYVEWDKRLPREHKVLTFNYDLVPDLLGFWVVPPGGSDRTTLNNMTYKLHGSLKWTRTGIDKAAHFTASADAVDLRGTSGMNIGIATPGPTKRNAVVGPLRKLWEQACYELQQANSIVFVGYRFPPSDSEARTRLLEAIALNDSPLLVINTVLGDNVHSPDARRLNALLEAVLQNSGRKRDDSAHLEGFNPHPKDKFYVLRAHPLFSQDFVSIWSPRMTE